MSLTSTAYSAVSVSPPCVPLSLIAEQTGRQFDLDGRYAPLVSERDQNLKLTVDDGAEYVVKVTSPAESPLVSEFRVAALLHLANVASPQVPKLVRTRDGRSCGEINHDGQRYRLRLVSYLAGNLLASAAMDSNLVRDFGAKLATLDKQLQDFRHAGDSPALLWDLQRAIELRDLLGHIDDPIAQEHAAAAIDDFEANVKPQLATLRTQVIHGDPNPDNILVDPSGTRVTGIIDFGDMVRAPLIFDVAIAAAYLRTENADSLGLIAPFVAGYHATLPLTEAELALLFDLVRTRLATTITLLYWRLGARADDDPYRRKTLQQEADAVRFLRALDRLGQADFGRILLRAL